MTRKSLESLPGIINKHKPGRKIIGKFWHLLCIDPLLSPYVPQCPAITYRRASSLKDQVVQSEFVGKFHKDLCKRMGTFTCSGCPICQYMNTWQDILLPNGQPYKPHHFFNCKTEGVVYLLTCQCQQFYVGKTKLKFYKRASRHITSMKMTNPELPLGRHVDKQHEGKFPRIQFLILDRIHSNPRGGDWNKVPLHREARWIADLGATAPTGLNEHLSFRPFLEGFSLGGCEKE